MELETVAHITKIKKKYIPKKCKHNRRIYKWNI